MTSCTTITIAPTEGAPVVTARVTTDEAGKPRITALTITGDDLTELPSLDLATVLTLATGNGKPVKAVKAVKTARLVAITRDEDSGIPDAVPAKATRARAPRTDDEGKRAYRRYPGDGEMADVVRQTGQSITALADHFEVPRGTASRWLRAFKSSAPDSA